MIKQPNCTLFIWVKQKLFMAYSVSDIIGDINLLSPEYLKAINYTRSDGNYFASDKFFMDEYEETSRLSSKFSTYIGIQERIVSENKQKQKRANQNKLPDDDEMYMSTEAYLSYENGIYITYGDNPLTPTTIHIADDSTVSLKTENSPLPLLVFDKNYPVYVATANSVMSRYLFCYEDEDDSHQIKLTTKKLKTKITEKEVSAEISYLLELDSSKLEEVSFSFKAVLSAERN